MSAVSKWGNPFQYQISASASKYRQVQEVIPAVRFLGIRVKRSRTKRSGYYEDLSTERGHIIPDEVCASRKFLHTCGLIRAIHVFTTETSVMHLYLEGFKNFAIQMSKIMFRFDPNLADGPVAEITIEGIGTRHDVDIRELTGISLVFRNQEELKERIRAVPGHPGTKISITNTSSRQTSFGWDGF